MMNIYGYVNLYVKLNLNVDGTEKDAYVSCNGEFSKPLTEEFFQMFLISTIENAERLNFNVLSAEYCTKEEYDAHENDYKTISFPWDK